MRVQSRYDKILKPLNKAETQCYLGRELHVAGLLGWLLDQTGPADVVVTTYSTSDDFLCSFIRLKKEGLVNHSTLLADFRACKRTHQLGAFMKNAFDEVKFGENHSKLMLVKTKAMKVLVLTSQNQTYGSRHESTMVTTDKKIFDYFNKRLQKVLKESANFKEWNSPENS